MTVDLHVALDGGRDLAGQVYRQIRAAILDGRLRPRQTLPSSRDLARRLGISRNTVTVAYDHLVAEGFLVSRPRAGVDVSPTIRPSGLPRPTPTGSPLRPRPVWDGIETPGDLSSLRPTYDLRPGVPDARGFPYATWRALMAAQFRHSAVRAAAHIDPSGDPGLRAALARHVAVSRGVHASADDVLVTNGSQQAIDLIARVLVEPGELVVVEDPAYSPPRFAFQSHGAKVVGVPVDGEGLMVDALPDAARLVYVTPAHQYPLGMSMSLPRRLALLEWAERADAVIVEDDYDSEFRYGGRPLEPLQSLDGGGRVLYVGSLSKVLLPTLRLGFLVAPASLHVALRKAKWVSDWHTTVPLQAAAAQFIDQGLLARHLRRMRRVYAERHEHLETALHTELAEHLDPIPSPAGLHLTALLRRGGPGDDTAVAASALADGVATLPLTGFEVSGPPRAGLLLGYGAITADRIDEGLRRLRRHLERLPPASPA